jgi:nucleoside-diphosphate-sugar epimerase
VTGATGFVGRHLARRLLADGWALHLVVRPSSKLERLGELRAAAAVHAHDGSTARMLEIVGSAAPDTVFHLAAEGGAGHAPEDLRALLESNVVLGTQLLEAMVAHGVARIVCTGSHWQHYGGADYSPVSLYAACKEAFDRILRFYVEARGARAVTLVLFETYGGDDPRRRILNLLREAARSGVALEMTAGEQYLDLVHVDDVVEAYCLAAARLHAGEVGAQESFAVRSGSPIRLRELVAQFGQALGRDVPVRWGARPYRAREVMTPWKGGQTLPGWQPRVTLRDGLLGLR